MTKVITEKDTLIRIIKIYKKLPCLWDPTHKLYYKKRVRNEHWAKLLAIWRQFEPNSPLRVLQRKIEVLRATYRKEWKRVKSSKANGVSQDKVYKPTLWYYNLMSFLTANSDSSNNESSNEEDEKYAQQSPRKKRRLSQTRDPYYRTENHDNSESESDDCTTTYGMTVARQLKELDDEVRSEAERIIADVLEKARMGMLPKKQKAESAQTVDIFIPESGPSWYDIPTEKQPTECFAVTVADPSEQQAAETEEQRTQE